MLKPLYIEPTEKTPNVVFDPNNNVFSISGTSIPENSVGFYKPLSDWLSEYSLNPNPRTNLNIKIEYCNTSSSKCILELMRHVEEIYKKGNDVLITWHYEDEDSAETGFDCEALIDCPFNFVDYETKRR